MTISLIAAAAITTIAFKAPKNEKITNQSIVTTEKENNSISFHTTNYTVDAKQTTSSWLAKKVGGQHGGAITLSSGNINVDHGTIKSGSFTFDMTSITCTDLTDAEWNKKLIDHLKSDDFFSVAKNPTAKFELTKATLKSENSYNITGKLSAAVNMKHLEMDKDYFNRYNPGNNRLFYRL